MSKKFEVTQYGLIFDAQKRILLTKSTHVTIRGLWVLPGGHIDDQ